LFCDHSGAYLGAFASNIGTSSVFFAEVSGYILALEYAATNGWKNIWLESDSTSALAIFKIDYLVPVLLRNRWHNARSQGLQVIASHIFREGNSCADLLANLGHLYMTRFGSRRYRKHYFLISLGTGMPCLTSGFLRWCLLFFSLSFSFIFAILFRGFWPSPPSCTSFPFF